MSDIIFFFSGWEPLGRILVVGTLMYISLVVLLRLSGSRTLASMNAFDFIVTVAMGSAFGRALTAKGVALSEAIVTFALLIGLQYAVAWLQTRCPYFARLLKNPPVLLYYQGSIMWEAMNRERVTESDLRAAARKQRFGSLEEVQAVILESSGDLSVIGSIPDPSILEKMRPHSVVDNSKT